MDLTEYVNSLPEAKPEQASTYLANKDKTLMTYNYDDGVDADYRYEVEQKKQARNAFFGKSAIEYKELTRNPLTSAFKGAYSAVVGLPANTLKSGYSLGNYAFEKLNPGALNDQELADSLGALNGKIDAWLEKYGAEKDEKDLSLAYDVGSVFGSLGLSWTLRSPMLAGLMFGTSQQGSLYQEMRERGIDADKAMLTSLAGGTAEGALEFVGLHLFLENFATKKLGSFLIKQGATEFTQEFSQQFAEEMLMKYAGGRVDDVTGKAKTFLRIIKDSSYAGALGALAGFGGGAVSTKSLTAFKGQAQKVLERGGMKKEEASRFIEERLYGNEKQQKELQDKVNDTIKEINTKSAALEFKKLGIEEEKAQELAESLATNPDDVKSELIDVLNKEADFETLQNNSLADDVAYFKEQRKKDMVAEAFDIKEKIKEDAVKAGVSEEEAEVAAALEANFALRMFEETGETPLEYYENKRALYETENGEPINESELTEEETARLEAQEQARKAEEDIPFFQFAGQKAQTAALGELNNAKQLEADGVDNEQIRQQTGWFKGVDGKWRFEIPDGEIKDDFSIEKHREWIDDGTAMAYEPETFYQSAFAGSRVDYDRPSLEAIGSGEGNQAHGWGLYYALSKDVAEGYRESFVGDKWKTNWEINGIPLKEFLGELYNDRIDTITKKIHSPTAKSVKENLMSILYDDAIEYRKAYKQGHKSLFDKNAEPYHNPKDLELAELADEKRQELATYSEKDFKVAKGQVHEVDIPENPYLLDEQKILGEQSPLVKKALKEVAKEIGVKWDSRYDNGKYIYDNIANVLGSKKAASQMLEKYGIKGITYDGRQDGRCFVIFNPADVRVIQKFYQGENNPLGSYMPASRVIHLFKKANRSTLIHELGHHFTMQYVKALEANGRTDKLEGFYNWLGINNISEATTETWEQMARGFETYVMEGEAPNIDTESLFQKFKKYLIGVYTDLKGKVIKPEEINDDVREFFDIMIAGEEEAPDVRGLEGKLDQIKSAISGALKGEEVNFEGLSTKDLRELVKLMTMRKPRKPQNLKQKIRSVGGIDIDFAKAIGIYDSKKGNENGFFKKGGIDREDSLIDFLTEEGYIANTGAETYEETSAIMDQVIRLLENADNAYTAEEQQKMDERDAIEGVAYEAAKTLGNINTDDIFKAIKVLQKYDVKPVDKNTLKYLNASIKQVEKLAKEAKKEIRQAEKDIANKQADLIDYVKKLPLSYKSQMKIIERLKRATLAKDFEKVIDEAAELGKEFYREEKKKMLAGMINDEIKSSRPKKVTEQKYDYKNNKLFKDLRDYSKMTQDQAAEQLSGAEVSEDTTDEDLIRMRYLNYKSNGAKTSTELLEQIYTDLIIAKQNGMAAKDDADFERSMNRETIRQAIIDAIDANDADKNTLKTRIGNLYRKGLTNLYSLINSISSKKLADAFEMETVLNDAQVKYHKQTEALKEKTFKVYGVKTAGDLLNKFADMGKTIGHLYNVDGIKAEEISVMKLIDIYNAMRNEKTRQDYINNYGEEQLDRLLSNLTPQDIAFADLMMDDINSLFPEVNKTYIKIYGMDLLKVENYWPATSEHTTETSMLGDYYSQQTTPSSWKERTKGRVTPIPSNAWTKYLKHINENIYMINTAEKYKELATVFKSKRIRNKITNKFGASVYGELMRQISALSLNAKSDSLNYIESAFGSILNNFVVAKIAVAPTVFAGQLTSVTNYAENVKSSTFYKYFAEGLAHPKQTIKFMKEIAGDFLEARYKGGYAESISNVLREAEDAMSQKYRLISPKTKYNTANALSSFVRMGDIGAIIFGGYGQVKANLEAGMSIDEAVKRFEFDTLRSQQSSVKSSLGSFQQSKGIARMFLAFKNTQHQYFRKIADALINLQRGEISKAQAAKIIGNYALIQTTLYVMAKNLVNAGLGLLDDDDKITDGVLEQILLGTLDAIPFLSDALHFAYRRLTGTYSPNLVSMVGIDDIQRSINKFYKDEKSVYDYIEIITPLIEGTTSLPVQRFERMFKKWTGE